jgi:hypothetical protein
MLDLRWGRSIQITGAAIDSHEGRLDLWNGVVASPLAITLRDKSS